MAKTFFPFDTIPVMEADWVKMAKRWRNDGVLVENQVIDVTSNDLVVQAGTGLQATIAPGKAWIQGHYFESDATETVTFASNIGAANNRIDRVTVQVDWIQNKMDFVVLQGGTDGNPPALPNSSAKYYLSLAQVTISKTADSIVSVKDERVPSTHKTFHNSIVLRKSGTDATINANTTVDILWDLREIDSMRQHDGNGSNSSTFTLKEDGQYHVGFNLSVSSATASQLVKAVLIRKRSGVETGIAMDTALTAASSVQVGLNAHRLLNCKAGDQFLVRFTNYSTSAAVSLNISGLYSPVFYAEKVGAVGYSFSGDY